MTETNSLKVIVYGATAEVVQELGEALKKQYRFVVCTGIAENTKPPHVGTYRAYYTIVLEDSGDE